jgi:hypothetical protein
VVAEIGEQPARRSAGVRLSELVAALSFSSDLALGQPMEHVLRSCFIALRLADHLDLDEQQRAETWDWPRSSRGGVGPTTSVR